jgi:hypothetical protein
MIKVIHLLMNSLLLIALVVFAALNYHDRITAEPTVQQCEIVKITLDEK